MTQQGRQVNRPIKMNLDKDTKHLTPEEAFYLLNHERDLNIDGKVRGTLGKTTPKAANYPACEIEYPVGENYVTGAHYSPLANETYSWHYNSNNQHSIFRVTENGCEVVIDDPCLRVNPFPRHSIEQWRAFLRIEKTQCKNRHGKTLIWVDGTEKPIGAVDVEAAIATNGFTTPFFDTCLEDRCHLMQLCVPTPCGCVAAKWVNFVPADAHEPNFMLDKVFKIAFRHIYYDNRASEWSDPSSAYYVLNVGCFDSSSGLPRCLQLRLPVGNPQVDRIEVAYTTDDGATWYVYETIEKYEPYASPDQKWYERSLSKVILQSQYSQDDCSFDFKFCAEKQQRAVDPEQINRRVFNPMPMAPQGLLSVEDTLGYYNYNTGVCKLDKNEIKKFKIETSCLEKDCQPDFVKVTVRAIIHNTAHDRNQFVYRTGKGNADDLAESAQFGGLNDMDAGGWERGDIYEQRFDGKVRNFRVYIEGTEYSAEMKQWRSDASFSSKQQVGIVTNMDDNDTRYDIRYKMEQGVYYYQECTLMVPKGTKGFLRLMSHRGEEFDSNTSTFVMGTIPDIRVYKGNIDVDQIMTTGRDKFEIYFEACTDKEVEIRETFVIRDNAVDRSLATKASAYHGYVKDSYGRPVEGLHIVDTNDYNAVRAVTDHNGFYHFYHNQGINDQIEKHLFGEVAGGNFGRIKTIFIQSRSGSNQRVDVKIEDTDINYGTKHLLRFEQRVVDCSGAGVAGVRIAISGGKYVTTKSDGVATFIIRNYRTRNRTVTGVVIDRKGCITADCSNNCLSCQRSFQNAATPDSYENGVTFRNAENFIINTGRAASGSRGLKRGGLYPFGLVAEWECGKVSGVQELDYISIPSIQQLGERRFCSFSFSTNGMRLPSGVKCLKIVRGENMKPFELQWLVDKVERLSDGKIRLTIQSLSDYNEQYDFKTNTVYGFVPGDRVEFIRNGDNTYFTSSGQGNINLLIVSPFHDKVKSGRDESTDDFFNQIVVEDDSRLADLKAGALIELQRPRPASENPIYYTFCASIPVDENGELLVSSGTFEAFDSFLVNRKIGEFPSQSFEHHSPNDVMPAKVSDRGRAYVVNEYENERREGRWITLAHKEAFNQFGGLVKKFDTPEQGDIVAMNIVDGSVILGICENDNFIARAADDFLRVGGDGVIRALPPDQIISDGQPKIRGQFGCQYEDIGSILFGDGFATWVDSRRMAQVKHDYNEPVAISEGQAQSYFMQRCAEFKRHNSVYALEPLEHLRWSVGSNLISGSVFLTAKKLRGDGINNEKKPYVKQNETISFDPKTNDYLGFLSFTAERYSTFRLSDDGGCAFVSYLHGIPYFHTIIPIKWNEFFGVPVDRVVGISINQSPEKVKTAVSFELQSESMWYVSEVTTEMSRFASEIPPVRVKGGAGKWNAEFLGNKNSRGGLFSGEPPRGYAIDVTFVRDNTNGLEYGTRDHLKMTSYDELDLILFKYLQNEQSGFELNV